MIYLVAVKVNVKALEDVFFNDVLSILTSNLLVWFWKSLFALCKLKGCNMHHLHCFILGNPLQCQQRKHSELKAKVHNLKYLFHWNFKAFEFLFIYIHHSLASLSVLFKYKSLSFGNLSLFLYHVSVFWLEHLYILPKFQRPALKEHILWCKTGIL